MISTLNISEETTRFFATLGKIKGRSLCAFKKLFFRERATRQRITYIHIIMNGKKRSLTKKILFRTSTIQEMYDVGGEYDGSFFSGLCSVHNSINHPIRHFFCSLSGSIHYA